MDQQADHARVGLSTGVTLPYVWVGPSSGVPVLLLHAWGESRGSFARLMPALTEGVRAVAMDLRGHGEADTPSTGYSLTVLAEDVVAFMDALDISAAVLLGSSSGGYIAQQVAVTHPDRVSGLLLAGSPRSLQGRPSFADQVDALSDPVDPAWVMQLLTWFPRFHPVPEWYVDDRVRDGVLLAAHVWRETFYGLCNAEPPTETATIAAPALIVWGERDRLLPREQQEQLARAITGSRLLVYENTGHLVLWEQPDRLARDLMKFVRVLQRRSR
jgi:pimeloyl-ACP methyl ester carboxylesterase